MVLHVLSGFTFRAGLTGYCRNIVGGRPSSVEHRAEESSAEKLLSFWTIKFLAFSFFIRHTANGQA